MRRFKKLFSEAKIEVDDISVGKKKKAPAGVKVDPNLKGYAYNEKNRVTDIDVEQGERDLKMAKLKKAKQKVQNEDSDGSHDMSLDDIKKRYAKEIIRFQDGDGDLSHGAKMAMMGYVGSDAIKTDDPDEFDNFVLGLKMGKYKKTNEQQSMDTLLNMLDETNLDEALSPKEKEKRLIMIKKAVEKLNRANLEKVKRMAMRDMKASGMFDDAMDEHVKGGGDSYDALQNAKAKARDQGKVWDSLGRDVKDRLLDKEMVALGYEKKPGNSQYTKVPTEKEKAFADKVRADNDKVRKMSDKDKTQYYIDNPNKSQGGDTVSEKGKIKIKISEYQAVVQKYENFAQKAMEKAMEAEENDDDMAFEKYQDEEQAYQDKADDFRRKVDELKDKLSDME